MDFTWSFCICLCAIISNFGGLSIGSSKLCPKATMISGEIVCFKEPTGNLCLVCPENKSNNTLWQRNAEPIFTNGVQTRNGPFKRTSCHPNNESLEVYDVTEVVYKCAIGTAENIKREFVLKIEVQTTLQIRKVSSVGMVNNTFNESRTDIFLECIIHDAYGNVTLAWYVNNIFEQQEIFYDGLEYGDKNGTYRSIFKYHNTSKTDEVTCRSSGPFIKDANASLTLNPNFCTSEQCQQGAQATFWSRSGVFLLVLLTGVCISLGVLVYFVKRKCGGHAASLRITRYEDFNRAHETYRTAPDFTPSNTETETDPGLSKQQNENDFEVRREVQIKGTSTFEYWKGRLITQGHKGRSCFIKTLSAKSTLEKAFIFKQLAEDLSKLKTHENIVDVLSILVVDVPYSIYFEYVECGNLRDFITTRYQQAGVSQMCVYSTVAKATVFNRQIQELLSFSQDIASGMEYLQSNKFCHPALALRKVLLTEHIRCKLYDIHPLKMAMQRITEVLNKDHSPTAWLAPETIFMKEYTNASDAWNYAVVLWEIFSLGVTPYAGMEKPQVEHNIRQSVVLSRPPRCPGAIFSLMLSCWKKSKDERPGFEVIRRHCVNLLKGTYSIKRSRSSSQKDECSDDGRNLDEYTIVEEEVESI